MIGEKCKRCRRLGQKLFLKGEKCLSPKCPMIRRAYPPGQKGKRRLGSLSEYGRELREKQRLRLWYNLKEAQFKKYVKEVLQKRGRGEASENLIRRIESRLDNIIFRLGLAGSRTHARQLVVHGFFLINNKKTKSPSYQTKKGDKITITSSKKKKKAVQEMAVSLKKYPVPSWLKIDKDKIEAEIIGEPFLRDVSPPAEILSIFEFYSR